MYEYDEERDGKITDEEYDTCMEFQIVANESAFDVIEAIREQLKHDGKDYVSVLMKMSDKFSSLISADRFSTFAEMIEDLCLTCNVEPSPWADYIRNRNNKMFLRQSIACAFAGPFVPKRKFERGTFQPYYPPRPERRRDTGIKAKQNKTEPTHDDVPKNSAQVNEKIESVSPQVNQPVEEVPYRKIKLDELTMADCNEMSRKFLRKLYETGADGVKKLYFCSLQDSKSQKKFMKAINAYAKLVPHEIPILCFDDTVFGGAEDGFLVTTHGIHIHNQNETSAKFVSFKDVESITLNEKFAQSELLINGEIKAVMTGLNRADCNNIWVAVNFMKVCLEIYE